MDFGRGDEVNREPPLGQSRENALVEIVKQRSLIRMYIDHNDLVFDRHRSGPFWPGVFQDT